MTDDWDTHYEIEIEMPSAFAFAVNSNTFANIIRRYANSKGWGIAYSGFIDGKFRAYLYPIGTIAIVYVVIGIAALLVMIGVFLRTAYLIRRVSDNNVIAQAEMTEQGAIAALENIVNDTTIDDDIREEAAVKIIELSDDVIIKPPVIPPGDDKESWLDGSKNLIVIAIGLGLFALALKK